MKRKILYIIGGIILLFIILVIISPTPKTENNQNATQQSIPENSETVKNQTESKNLEEKYYPIVSVVDGDTLKINKAGGIVTLRLIGLDTPETVDPRKPVQCFGVEASNKAKELLSGKTIKIETDETQGTIDKYGRTLAYIYLPDGTFYNKYMIEQGYAHEYTYNLPYKYQTEFKNAEKNAREKLLGLWSPTTCGGNTETAVKTDIQPVVNNNGCSIKGNISITNSEKIYHMIGCGSYNKTVIDESKGERWFCTEQEAISAGWRKALNC